MYYGYEAFVEYVVDIVGLCPPKTYVEVLNCDTYQCDLIWK